MHRRALTQPLLPPAVADYSPLRACRGMLEQLDQLQAVLEGALEELRAFRELMVEAPPTAAGAHFPGGG